MFGGATGLTDTTSGSILMAPTPDANYVIKIYGNAMPTGLGSGADGNSHTYVSNYFPQGLLYACLVEAFSFLKGPQDMLTLYEQKYKQELQKFASNANWKKKTRRLHGWYNKNTDRVTASIIRRKIMAITSAICNSFKVEILTATHNFTASSQETLLT